MPLDSEDAKTAPHSQTGTLPNFGRLDLPSLGKSLGEMYKIGSLPLVLVFLAAAVIIGFLWQGVLATLPLITWLIFALLALGVMLFLAINWLGYRHWHDEVKVRLDNRRLEMDLYFKLSTANSESQDQFLLSILKYVGDLGNKDGSSPEGRKLEIKFLTESLGALVNDFVSIRNQLKLPSFTTAFPENTPVRNIGGGVGRNTAIGSPPHQSSESPPRLGPGSGRTPIIGGPSIPLGPAVGRNTTIGSPPHQSTQSTSNEEPR
jgi:hypothetical protein